MKNPISQVKKFIASIGSPARSPRWPATRRHHLQLEYWCRVCGGMTNVEVHHIAPFHLHPELELVDSNLITLCERLGPECHLKQGHLGNWKNFNPHIREIATATKPIIR